MDHNYMDRNEDTTLCVIFIIVDAAADLSMSLKLHNQKNDEIVAFCFKIEWQQSK